uniref:Uncharacterized protein n=1 Tax=Cacopsylla melanoneura TaxID=428564 RepID=A0A8D8YQA8_9HEMI
MTLETPCINFGYVTKYLTTRKNPTLNLNSLTYTVKMLRWVGGGNLMNTIFIFFFFTCWLPIPYFFFLFFRSILKTDIDPWGYCFIKLMLLVLLAVLLAKTSKKCQNLAKSRVYQKMYIIIMNQIVHENELKNSMHICIYIK